ncbi:MAG: nucleotidyl transferase AbiEii/AbiGii toxin family protein, partial [Lachnospiraceae bacterium]|nr:nucleotidyl transferase AbiEii/AbiGii toxin family protein [Lachnospiraceae bacterium]
MNKNWRTEHNSAIDAFLKHLNANTQTFILKGGTALMKCYGLDRFSEDIDLDGDLKSKDIVSLVDSFCSANGFSYRIAKNTDTVKRFFVNYGNSEKPLKVEVSYRQKELNMKQASIVNGILVYNINALCMLKTNAYAARDKIRDLYDISFICDKYFDSLSETVVD